MIDYKFDPATDTGFAKAVRTKVNQYFEANGIDRKANAQMVRKSILGVVIYFGIYALIMSDAISQMGIVFCLWGLLGLAQAWVGMTAMHDILHGSYSNSKWVRFIMKFPVIAIGVEGEIWRIEHNTLHHNYTNVTGWDDDIETRHVFRFNQHQKRRWFHRFQFLYATFVYALLIVEWVTIKDFVKVYRYHKKGLIETAAKAWKLVVSIIIKKILFHLVFLVVPVFVLDYTLITTLAMYFTMLAAAGVSLTVIFQLAHVVEGVDHFDGNKEAGRSWHAHQLMTTANFANGGKGLGYVLGGLNYQIEHHLFPDVCHVHYPAISKIVEETAHSYDLPYHVHDTMWDAVKGHYVRLWRMGRI